MSTLDIGQQAPDFTVETTQGTSPCPTSSPPPRVASSSTSTRRLPRPAARRRPAISAIPSPPCRGAGYSVIGVSADSMAALERFTEKQSLTFPLASDPEHHILEAYGAWGEKKNYGRTYVGIIRSTVVVAPDGTVALAQYNVKATGHVARLRKALGID